MLNSKLIDVNFTSPRHSNENESANHIGNPSIGGQYSEASTMDLIPITQQVMAQTHSSWPRPNSLCALVHLVPTIAQI